jgi:hypothetical protein
LNALHAERALVQDRLADHLLERSLGNRVDTDEVIRLSDERERLDARIDEQSSIVQRFEHRLWEFQAAAAARQHDEDIDAIDRIAAEGQELADAYDRAVLELARLGARLYALGETFTAHQGRAMSYWTANPDARKPVMNVRPIKPYDVPREFLYGHPQYDVAQFVAEKAAGRPAG